MKIRSFLACIMLVIGLMAYGQKEGRILLKNVNLVDLSGKGKMNKANILIDQGQIADIYTGNKKVEVDQEIDLTGKYLIPGLIDAHVHLVNMPFDDSEKRHAHMDRLLTAFLMGGVTSVRDMAGDARQLAELKRASVMHEITAPNIYYAAFMAGPTYYKEMGREQEAVKGWHSRYAPWLQCVTNETNLTYAIAQAIGSGASRS